MSIEGIDHLDTDAALALAGQLSDVAIDVREPTGVERAITILEEVQKRELSAEQKTTALYFAGTSWSSLRELRRTTSEAAWAWEQGELENEITNLRRAANPESIDAVPLVRQCQILTNIANAFDHVGRFVEAIEFYDRALARQAGFAMARGNRGCALLEYGRFLYDGGHQRIFLQEIYPDLKAALEGDLYESARKHFSDRKEQIERALPQEILERRFDMESFSLGDSDEEKGYRTWCLENRLFLNPLNDLAPRPVASTDVLGTPSIVVKLGEGPYYQGLFNQMKQEYVAARWLLYEAMHNADPHFSDRHVLLFNTLDYPSYSLAVEKAKASFRMAFSIFDKIAFFLNRYLALSIRNSDIAFRRIWYVSQERRKGLKPMFRANSNWPLRGLFWLSKDLYDDEPGFRDALEPDARELASLRNHGEHMYLKLHDSLWPGPPELDDVITRGRTDTLAHSIYREDFEAKALRLLKMVRAALIYLALSVESEERRRAAKRGPDAIVPPMPLDTIDDDWKV